MGEKATKSERIWTYLRPADIAYLDAVRTLLSGGNPPDMSRGEALRFCLRLLRLILPRIEWIRDAVLEAVNREGEKGV